MQQLHGAVHTLPNISRGLTFAIAHQTHNKQNERNEVACSTFIAQSSLFSMHHFQSMHIAHVARQKDIRSFAPLNMYGHKFFPPKCV